MSNRTLYIDCQVFQTPAWHRGMGKYSFFLLQNMFTKESPYDNVVLIFNTTQSIPRELQSFIKTLPKYVTTKKIKLEMPDIPNKNNIAELLRANKKILNAYIQNSERAEEVDYLILALFIDHIASVFPDDVKKLLLFYDIIPFQYPIRYAQFAGFFDNFYFPRFPVVFEADKILTISQTVANDLNLYLGITPGKLGTIDGAPISRLHLESSAPSTVIKKPYILMPTGDELRKNNLRSVRAFERFRQLFNHQDVTLVTTSTYTDAGKQELLAYAPDTIFTGNVSEGELAWLYTHAELILFASEYEGLGLPVLEAAEYNKPIVCSDIPVFKEISEDAFYYADPMDSTSIANALQQAYMGTDWEKKSALYKAFLNTYSWENTVDKLNKHILQSPHEGVSENDLKPKLAIVTPHPNGFSAVGKVTTETHDALSAQFAIDYYFDYGPSHVPNFRVEFLSYIADCYKASTFAAGKYRQYDTVLYHIGNSNYHLNALKDALILPGYVIMHDTFLDGAYNWMERTEVMSKNRIKAEKRMNKGSSTSSFITSLVNSQLGIIVHSDFAYQAIKTRLHTPVPIIKLNLPVATSKFSAQSAIKEQITIGLAGILADIKGIEAIDVLARSEEFSNCIFKVFGLTLGAPQSLFDLAELPNVELIKDPSDFEFQTLLSRLDVLVNYRMAYNGETSLTTLEAMRYGVATIVRDFGWYSELPDSAVVKVNSIDALQQSLSLLISDRQFREKIGAEAQKYTSSEHSHEAYAKKLAAFIADTSTSSASNQKIAELIKSNAHLNKLAEFIRSNYRPN